MADLNHSDRVILVGDCWLSSLIAVPNTATRWRGIERLAGEPKMGSFLFKLPIFGPF